MWAALFCCHKPKLKKKIFFRLIWLRKPGLKIENVTGPRESLAIINSYEEIIKTQNKKTKENVAKHGKMLKKFRYTEDFIIKMRPRRSSIYFKIGL